MSESGKESRIVATDRLRREGRWEEASAYRDEVRLALSAEGKPRTEASGAAWSAMIAKFPPLPAADPLAIEIGVEEEAADFEAMLARTKGNPPDVDRDVMWVYEKLDVQTAVPDDAPSLGAWGLLKWARTNRDRFFEQMLPKAMASIQKRKPGGSTEDDDDGVVVDMGIEFVRERLREAMLQMHEEFIEDAPSFIANETRKLLEDWKQRFEMEIPPDLSTMLHHGLTSSVYVCVEAAIKNPDEYKRNNKEFRKRHW